MKKNPNDPFADMKELSYNSDESGFKSNASRHNFWEGGGIEPPVTNKLGANGSKSSLDLTSQFSLADTIRTGYGSKIH